MELNENNLSYVYNVLNPVFKLNIIAINKKNEIIRLNSSKVNQDFRYKEELIVEDILNKDNCKERPIICYYENEDKMNYLGLNVYCNNEYEGILIIGPYTTVHEVTYRDEYKNIPVITVLQEKSLEAIVLSLIHFDNTVQPLIYHSKNYMQKTNNINNGYKLIKEFDIGGDTIRERYKNEDIFLHYISEGNISKIEEVLNQKMDFEMEINRFPEEPLRNLKNLMIIMNTLLRKIVQQKNIDPYIINLISEHYARKIELSNKIDILKEIFKDMIRQYCKLINDYKLDKHSDLVNRAINYIRLNSNYDISVSSIAKELFIHPSHLARKFKDETQNTISEYINEIRIKDAKFMLKTTELKIEEIAYTVGFNDTKYFSRIFKKTTDMPPSKYRKYYKI